MATRTQIEAFEALVDAVARHPKTLEFPAVECEGIDCSPEEICVLLERNPEKMPDQVVDKLRALGCVGVAANKSSYAVGVRKVRDLIKRHEAANEAS